jgi:hypothetical protein
MTSTAELFNAPSAPTASDEMVPGPLLTQLFMFVGRLRRANSFDTIYCLGLFGSSLFYFIEHLLD